METRAAKTPLGISAAFPRGRLKCSTGRCVVGRGRWPREWVGLDWLWCVEGLRGRDDNRQSLAVLSVVRG